MIKTTIKNIIFAIIAVSSVFSIITSCANRGQGPQGGPKDTIPPSVVKSFPPEKTLNYDKRRIEIIFDENVTVQKASEKVIISPPQQAAPSIQSYGKKLTVELNDSLQSNTTYSINFGDAIVDNNENNPLKNYVFAFSTGNTIDTLQISGTVIDAETLNPVSNVTVGIYDDFSDSAFMKKPFLRITKSDENGFFTIPNIKAGKYKVRALKDDSRDNMLQSGEGLAFNDTIFSPSVESYMRQDTIWKDSVKIDTIKSVKALKFLPNNVILRYFTDASGKKERFIKSERKNQNRFTLYFSAPATELPSLEPLNVNWKDKILIQKNATLDTLTYWITDTNAIKMDTLSLKMRYLRTDSTNHLAYTTDTLNIIYRHTGKKQTAKQSGEQEPKAEYLNITTDISNNFDVYKPITLSFDVPIKILDSLKIHLSEMRDTIPVPIKFSLEPQDSIGMKFRIKNNWKPETAYRLQIDSAAFYSIYELNSNKFIGNFKVKSLDDYSSLKLQLSSFDSLVVFQALNQKDEIVKSTPAKQNGTLIEYLQPGDYYIRMFIDRNHNGKWDAGNYLKNIQPEETYYYPKKLTLIKNWEVEETIDYQSVPLLKQKPKELIKKEKKDNKDNKN